MRPLSSFHCLPRLDTGCGPAVCKSFQTFSCFRLDMQTMAGKWKGETVEKCREMLQIVRDHAPSIIFIDEADALFSSRANSNSGADADVTQLRMCCVARARGDCGGRPAGSRRCSSRSSKWRASRTCR